MRPSCRLFAPLALGLTSLALSTMPVIGQQKGATEHVYDKTLPATVWVLVPLPETIVNGRGRMSTGSGSLIDRRLVLTNYHVVGDKDDVRIIFPIIEKGKTITERTRYRELMNAGYMPGKVLARDARVDLAVVLLATDPPREAQVLRIAADSIKPGRSVHSIGNPGEGALWSYTKGEVRAVTRKEYKSGGRDSAGGIDVAATVVETSSPVNEGDSGGPAVNDQGELVAVVQAYAPGSRLISYFIDVTEVWAFLKRHERTLKTAGIRPPTPGSGVAAKPSGQPRTTATSDTTKTEVDPKAQSSDKDAKGAGDSAESERFATNLLRSARQFADDGQVADARTQCEKIVSKYPKTKAATEAQQLLDKLKKK